MQRLALVHWIRTRVVILPIVSLAIFAMTSESVTAQAATDVTTAGVASDGMTDATAALQKLLDSGKTDLSFPRGTYLLGTIKLPADTRLDFAPCSKVSPNTDTLTPFEFTYAGTDQTVNALFHLQGSDITVRGLSIDLPDFLENKRLRNLIVFFGQGQNDLRFENINFVNRIAGTASLDELKKASADLPKGKQFRGNFVKGNPTILKLYDCRDVTLADSQAFNILHFIETFYCENVSVHGNRLEVGNTITTFNSGSRGLRHYDNWSRRVTYQCVFRGGSPDPSRKAPVVPLGSSTVVDRGLKPTDANYNRHLAGVYDISIKNNYAEYGRTLAWGNKGRQVIFEGNIARFMNDYCYGVEGCENVLFADNIAINGRYVGIMSMYYGEGIEVRGNVVMIRDEPFDPFYSDFEDPAQYRVGDFIRFHHGPTSKEDTAAGSIYGAGKVLVEGNLCINDAVMHRTPRVKFEPGRHAVVRNNKVVNGVIWKGGSGSVSVAGNEVRSSLPFEPAGISIGGTTDRSIVENNVISYAAGEVPFPEGQEVPSPLAGIQLGNNRAGHEFFVRGNTVEGLKKSIEITSEVTDEDPARYVVERNLVDGSLVVGGTTQQSYRLHASGNFDTGRFEEIKPDRVIVEAAP